MHHFIAVDDDVNRFEGVTQLLDLQGIASDRRIPLLYIVQLMLELKLACNRVGSHSLLPSWVVSMCWVGLIFVSSFD